MDHDGQRQFMTALQMATTVTHVHDAMRVINNDFHKYHENNNAELKQLSPLIQTLAEVSC